MSKLKVNELDTKTGTTITVAAGKTLDIPAGGTINVAGTQTIAGTQTVTGTTNLTASTLTLPTTLPATAGTNITGLPAANLTGQVPTSSLDNVQLAPLEDDIAVLGFQLAATQDVNKYNLQDQIIDTFQDNSGVDAALSTNETRSAAGKYYSGVAGNTGTGGTETSISISATDYLLHTFNADGNLDLDQDTTCDVLVVGGGGGGASGPGANGTGGGGAGGLVYQASRALLASSTYAITVGAGGTAGTSGGSGGGGGNSIFTDPVSNTITALGGGAGKGDSGGDGYAGGSGGGGTSNPSSTSGGAGNQADSGGGTGFGNAGGGGHNPSRGGGGGGGAGAAGTAGSGSYPNSTAAGPGGAGKDYSGVFGTAVGVSGWFAGGGGGSAADQATGFGTGGQGGGGAGNAETATPYAGGVSGTANTGGGGGGARGASGGGAGGKGVVIVRYALGGVAGNMTLVSTANTGTGTITKGDIVLLYTPVAGTTVLNTNLKAYVSRDNGTTYTQGTLVGKGSYSGTTSIASVHDIDISGQPAGVAMRWKIETLVQSAALETNINGVSLGWS